jgi:hypothetical protein
MESKVWMWLSLTLALPSTGNDEGVQVNPSSWFGELLNGMD